MKEEPTYEELLAQLKSLKENDTVRRTRARRRKWTLSSKLLVAAILIVIAGGVIAQVILFSQTTPTVTSGAAILSPKCSALVQNSTSPALGSSGWVSFTCSGLTPAYAFVVNANGPATPIFTLPAGFTNLTITNGPTTGSPTWCGGVGVFHVPLTSGTAVTFSTLQPTWSYCAGFATAPSSFSPFTVTWQQG